MEINMKKNKKAWWFKEIERLKMAQYGPCTTQFNTGPKFTQVVEVWVLRTIGPVGFSNWYVGELEW